MSFIYRSETPLIDAVMWSGCIISPGVFLVPAEDMSIEHDEDAGVNFKSHAYWIVRNDGQDPDGFDSDQELQRICFEEFGDALVVDIWMNDLDKALPLISDLAKHDNLLDEKYPKLAARLGFGELLNALLPASHLTGSQSWSDEEWLGISPELRALITSYSEGRRLRKILPAKTGIGFGKQSAQKASRSRL